MKLSRWINFLALVPSTSLTLSIIGIAFLRFYDERDFTILGIIAHPRDWSNRLTVAAILLALANFGVVEQSSCAAWNRRISLAARSANEKETAWLKQSNEESRKRNEERREIERKQLEDLRKTNEELRLRNKRLAELESKLNEILHS
jgi:DNA-binding transcriptional MerR regulator